MKKLISLSICLFLILLVKPNYASSIDPSSIDMNDPHTLQMIFQLGLGKVDELKENLIKNQKTQDDATKISQLRMMLGLYDEIRKQSRLMNPDPTSLEALQKLQQTVDKLGTDMWTDPALFAVVDNIDVSKLDNNAIRLINKAKRKFIRYEFKPASGKTIALHKVSESRVLEVLQCPDARLRTVAETVTVFDDKLQALIDDMFETMYEKDGIGLAATQINQHVRVVVMDISSNQNEPMVFINPKITILDDTTRPFIQGCLSVQGAYDSVTRPARVRIDALDRKGNPFSMEDSELIAVCIQHEIDHLNGKLFIDHLSEEKRKQIIARLENQTEN